MPVFLTDNIGCELELSNGTQGIFRELVYDYQENPAVLKAKNEVFPSTTVYVRKAVLRSRGNQYITSGKKPRWSSSKNNSYLTC